ncbi:hypothetical protein GCM10007977_054110 [Dactylosporangium sucinum]|uniref:Uncharacterized protein n=1 Tax=Dactylosporangium sucinum TaxID=1424081 RepID=A0A917WZQ3_9ACTN|nr:hypothetical protein GCM10007977_054110 [Dactylosporangium sucinum]
MFTIWLVVGVAAVAVVLVLATRRRSTPAAGPAVDRQSRTHREMGELVLTAYANEWATRLASTPEDLARAVRGGDPDLLAALDGLVGQVTVAFGADGSPRTGVTATVTVAYSDGKRRSTAQVQAPWDLVPSQARAAYLSGSAQQPLRFTWRAVPPATAAQN